MWNKVEGSFQIQILDSLTLAVSDLMAEPHKGTAMLARGSSSELVLVHGLTKAEQLNDA